MALPRDSLCSTPGPRALAAGALLGWGSLALPYAVVFNHHVVAGCLVTAAAVLLLGGQVRGSFERWRAVLAGGCAGLAATIDVAGGGIFLVVLAAWGLSVSPLRQRFLWGLGAVVAAGAFHTVLNWQITGDPIPVLVRPDYIVYPGSKLQRDELSGLLHHTSIGEFVRYTAGLVFGTSADRFGPRGLLLYSGPVFFAAMAAVRLVRRRGHPLRWAAVYLGAASVAYVLYLAAFSNNYSGDCYGIRWFVLLLPAAYLLLFGGWDVLSRGERVCAAVALASSVPIAWSGIIFGTWQGGQDLPFLPLLVYGLPVLFAVGLTFALNDWWKSRNPTSQAQ